MAKIVTVSELSQYLAGLLQGDPILKRIVVKGEISNFKRYSSGHCYFNLKDSGSIIPCVMFKSSAAKVVFQPENGMQILASGSVAVYAEGGKYQLYVSSMTPDGIGSLALAFEQLKEKLQREGLFDQQHKKELPLYPKTIGIVTSPTGAVLRDIYRVSKLRFPTIKLALKPVQVQGAGAAEQVAAAIDFFNEKYPVDVLIVGRGGGSIEDLWAFNEEVVVRAIYRSKIPVISAVGHETDTTLADYVADRRAATPSQAAEFAVRDVQEIKRYLAAVNQTLTKGLKGQLAHRYQRLDALERSLTANRIKQLLAGRQQGLDFLQERLERLSQQQLENKKHQLARLMDKLELMNPMSILKRGYSMTRREDGSVVRDVQEIQPADKVIVQVAKGSFVAQVTEVREV